MPITILKDVFKKKRDRGGPRTLDICDVIENSETPEVPHQKRTFSIGGVSFNSATEVDKFCYANGIDKNRLDIKPQILPQEAGKAIIHTEIVPKK